MYQRDYFLSKLGPGTCIEQIESAPINLKAMGLVAMTEIGYYKMIDQFLEVLNALDSVILTACGGDSDDGDHDYITYDNRGEEMYLAAIDLLVEYGRINDHQIIKRDIFY